MANFGIFIHIYQNKIKILIDPTTVLALLFLILVHRPLAPRYQQSLKLAFIIEYVPVSWN